MDNPEKLEKYMLYLQKAKVLDFAKKWLRGDIRLFMPSIDFKLLEVRGQFLLITFSECDPISSAYGWDLKSTKG